MGRLIQFGAIASSCLLVSVIGFCLWGLIQGSYSHLGVGRGHYTLDADREPYALRMTVTRFTRQLSEHHPDATLFRLTGYGWFVDNLRGSEFSAAGIVARTTSCDFEMTNRLFKMDCSLRLPFWLLAILVSFFPIAWLVFRLRRAGSV